MNKLLTAAFLYLLIFSSANSQWVIQYSSVPAQSVYCVKFFDDNTGYHSGVLYNSSTFNIYKTTNGGLNYTAQNSHYTTQRFMSIFILHPDTVFLSGNYGKIIRTVNGGQNWVTLYSDTTKQFWGLWFVNSQTGFVAGSHGTIMKTTNMGDNWITLSTSIQNALNGIFFINENTGYVGGANIVLKTTDAGTTWINKYGLFISGFETAQAVYFSDVNTGYYCTNTSNCRIVKTTNGGDNWTLIHSNEGIGAGWDMSFTNDMTGYVCTGSGKVLKTTDAGSTWGIQNTPLTENLYAIHFPSANTGYIASWSGKILKTTNGGLTYISKNEIASGYSLKQNFPNPFNPSTTISFSIAKASDVNLTVYDILGKEIVVLVNRRYEPGNYEVAWNAADYNSGVYLYTLTAGTYTETKKMLLIK